MELLTGQTPASHPRCRDRQVHLMEQREVCMTCMKMLYSQPSQRLTVSQALTGIANISETVEYIAGALRVTDGCALAAAALCVADGRASARRVAVDVVVGDLLDGVRWWCCCRHRCWLWCCCWCRCRLLLLLKCLCSCRHRSWSWWCCCWHLCQLLLLKCSCWSQCMGWCSSLVCAVVGVASTAAAAHIVAAAVGSGQIQVLLLMFLLLRNVVQVPLLNRVVQMPKLLLEVLVR